ncbi:MAG: aminopeptidase [Myxococcales bacterium]|nr:aminopeptidase [Myxococcales bacterium]
MAKSKSKHRRVRHTIRLKWKKRRERKKAAEKTAGAGKKAKK